MRRREPRARHSASTRPAATIGPLFGCIAALALGGCGAPVTQAVHDAQTTVDTPANRPLVWTREAPAEPALPMATPPSAVATRVVQPAPDAEPKRYGELIAAVADEIGVDARLVDAVVSVESNYNAASVSRKGAIGLMQVLPSTGRGLGFTNLRDAATNLRAGATYLKSLLARYDDDVTLALAAYNAGAGAVDRHGGRIPPYEETQRYVRKVLARYQAADDPAPPSVSLQAAAFDATDTLAGASSAAPATPRGGAAASTATTRSGKPDARDAWRAVRKVGSLLLSAPAD